MKGWLIVCGIGLLALTARTAPLAAEERVVHFFQDNALTGQAGSYGTRSIHGVELAAKHLNDAGGFSDTCGNKYTIKLSVWDMANSREQAIAGLRKAADDPTVLAVLGSTPSTGFAAMEPVAGQVKVPIIATGSAVPIKKWNPYAFRVTIATPVAAPYFLKRFKQVFDPKRVAIIYDITQGRGGPDPRPGRQDRLRDRRLRGLPGERHRLPGAAHHDQGDQSRVAGGLCRQHRGQQDH